MRRTAFSWRTSVRLLGSLAATVLLSWAGGTLAAESQPAPLPAVAPAPRVLDLQQCRDLARAQQPAIAAAHASLDAAIDKQQALDKLRFASIIQRDLPARRKQAAVGVEASQAAITQAECDTIYGVTFSYLSALYANEQLEVADAAIEDLKRLLESVDKSVKSGDARREIGTPQVELIKAHLLVAQGRREEAVQGLQRASSALREALGVAPDCPLALAQSKLPELNTTPDKDQIIALALARRGEMAQASAAYQATCFEIEAQRSTFFFSGKTFAIGSDIHSYPIPLADHGDNYRPGAVGIEMPSLLAGTRGDRVHQAETYHNRAGAVVEKTRNLITLDAEQTYFKWLEASKKVPYFREASAAANKAAEPYRSFNPGAGGKGTVEDVLNSGLYSTSVQLQLNQARYQALVGLAGLERATACGFCPGFESPR
jgi:outer membrane protein TolC